MFPKQFQFKHFGDRHFPALLKSISITLKTRKRAVIKNFIWYNCRIFGHLVEEYYKYLLYNAMISCLVSCLAWGTSMVGT